MPGADMCGVFTSLPTQPVAQVFPAAPLDPVFRFLVSSPLIGLGVLVALLIGINMGWKRLTIRSQDAGKPLAPLGMVLSRFRRLAFSEDIYPVVQKPEKLAEKLQWLTWRRWGRGMLLLTLWWLIVPPTNFVTLPGQDSTRLWLYGLGVLAVGWLVLMQHVRGVVAHRHRTMMQMFAVAASECKYESGSELNPWGYIQIQDWVNVYYPGVTAVMYPPRFRSEDLKVREAFERNFKGTVSDAHSWTYEWQSANNRVVCTPVPHITESAVYPFPDEHPWHVIPLGLAAGNEEATVDLTQFPHMLIAGTTGSGKSVTQRTILLHCLQQPQWRVVLIDPKRVELSMYKNAHNVLQVATELEDMTALIEQVEQEMQSRYQKMSEEGVNHFMDMANPPKAVLLMVDEVFALLSLENIKSDEGKERDEMHARCTGLIGSIARLGRAAGVHMVLATQRPDAKVLPGETRALALDTALPTPGGWTTVGQVETGDVVFDEAGQPTTVTGTTEVMYNHDCYRVRFSDGTSIVADGGHLWLTHDAAYRMNQSRAARRVGRGLVSRPYVQPKVVTTAHMADTLMYHGKRNHAIPVAGALALPEQELPIPPYVLGVWLGDGNRCATTFTSVDDGVVQAVRREGFDVSPVASDKRGVTWQFVEAGTAPSRWAPGVKGYLRDLNLLKNKHIPDVYARSSLRQRSELLQGLMDTDGHNVVRVPRGEGPLSASRVCFTSADRRLAGQVLELVRSLGYRPTLTSAPTQQFGGGGYSGGDVWKVMWTPHEEVFRLPRKVAGQNLHPEHTDVRGRYRYVVGVEKVESVPVKCIAVDSASHLFLAGEGMIPTHNSNLDCRVAQGRMDTTPSLMVLDSDAATNIPPVKGRAVVRTGNDFTEFQAYFCPTDDLPVVLEMCDGLASEKVTVADLVGGAEQVGGGGSGGVFGALRGVLGRVPRVRVPVPAGVRRRWRGWVERRRAVVAANDAQVGVLASGGEPEMSVADVAQVAAVQRSEVGAVGSPSMFVEADDEVAAERWGPRVGEVLAESGRRGEPVAASDLIAALELELVELEGEVEGVAGLGSGLPEEALRELEAARGGGYPDDFEEPEGGPAEEPDGFAGQVGVEELPPPEPAAAPPVPRRSNRPQGPPGAPQRPPAGRRPPRRPPVAGGGESAPQAPTGPRMPPPVDMP